MNLRQVWTEIFQKPAGRLLLFLLIGGIFLAFILLQRTPTKAGQHASRSSGHAGEELFLRRGHSAPSRAQSTPASEHTTRRLALHQHQNRRHPFHRRSSSRRSNRQRIVSLHGRLLRCELVNTVDSTNIDTPIIGLVIEDAWNDGRLIIPAGTEVHGVAQNLLSANASAPTGNGSWSFRTDENFPSPALCWTTRPIRRSPMPGTSQTARPDCEGFSSSPTCRGEGDPCLHDFRRSGHFLKRLPFFRRLAAQRKSTAEGSKAPFPPGSRPEGRSTPSVSWSSSTRTRLRSRSGRADVLPLHHTNGGFGQSHGGTFRIADLQQPQTAMKFLHSILLLSLVAGCATKKEVRSAARRSPCNLACGGRSAESSHAGNREGLSAGPLHRSEFPGGDARAAHALSPRTVG